MKFYTTKNDVNPDPTLTDEYKAGHEIGVIRVGKNNLFFKRRLKHYVIPFEEIKRMYRRVLLVPARMCCGKGDLAIENLVVCTDAGEAAVIQLPGTKAAKALIEELKELLPWVDFTSQTQKTE